MPPSIKIQKYHYIHITITSISGIEKIRSYTNLLIGKKTRKYLYKNIGPPLGWVDWLGFLLSFTNSITVNCSFYPAPVDNLQARVGTNIRTLTATYFVTFV